MLLLKMRYRDRFIVDMKEIKKPPYIGKRVSICVEKGCKLILMGGGVRIGCLPNCCNGWCKCRNREKSISR